MSETAAKALAKHKGGRLSLNGLIALPETTLEALVKYDGTLLLSSLTSLSGEAVMTLALQKRHLYLNGLTLLPGKAPVIPISPATSLATPATATIAGRENEFVLPPLNLLEQPPELAVRNIVDDIKAQARILKDTIREFGIEVESGDVTKGPTVTLFELHPAPGVLIDNIAKLSNNIAMAMRVETVRILTPVPGLGTVGIEVPNISRTTVYLRDMLESDEWRNHKGGIPVTLGHDMKGYPIIGDLAQMPHLLIAGATGSGKTVCINAILASLLYHYTLEELRLILLITV